MGSLYLSFLPDVVGDAARATGYTWSLFDDDWLHRARSSGGFDELPLAVFWHHTAGADNAWPEAEFMCHQADARPIANLVVDSRECIVMAGGATNTNGSGTNSPMAFSRGTVEKDNANRRVVGVEICNNGVGAPYSEKQMNFLFALSNGINARCGNQPRDVCTHEHYAPERKVDPSTAAAVQGLWKPRSVNSSGSWNCDDLRAECQRRAAAPAPAPSFPVAATAHEEGDPMFVAVKNGVYWIGNGIGRRKLPDRDELDTLIANFGKSGHPLVNWQTGKPVDAVGDITEAPQMDKLGVDVEAK